jgi:hypothetical protein
MFSLHLTPWCEIFEFMIQVAMDISFETWNEWLGTMKEFGEQKLLYAWFQNISAIASFHSNYKLLIK